ncbi:hypothetical protein [Methylobacter sp. S3L5C]|uniref:hypothetical protein n=1 Tax=Methylobacter sp. S3L5C TaxID=2839024 RepID=UPI001FABDDFB|nr:hypothetical protein [Methylobacter sp. S3L5C]UOA07637.1 hypothetical protein KKZ03_15405 [Methylobacter sp. S3L5C]
MSLTLFLILVAIGLLLVVIALAYRSKAKQAEHYAAIQSTIAEAALNQTQHRATLDQALTTVEHQQRQETLNETTATTLARRDGLDNDWAATAGLYDPAGTNYHTGSSAAAGTSGTTGD